MSDTVKVPWEWVARGSTPGLPPNLTRSELFAPGCCDEWTARFGPPFWCTRRAGHAGRHAAGGVRYILAVWS